MRIARLAAGIVLLAAAHNAAADDVWLQAAGATSVENSRRIGISRTFDTGTPVDLQLGLSHFAVDDTRWTLAAMGMNRRVGARMILDGNVEVGPGETDGDEFGYHKLKIGATWLVSPRRTLTLSDTYINIDASVGHIVTASLTQQLGGRFGITLDGISSAGGNLDTQQAGVKMRFRLPATILAGFYAGRTRNPIVLTETGGQFGSDATQLREAYVGLEVPLGRYTLVAVFDYTKLDDTPRRELSLALRVPLGTLGERE